MQASGAIAARVRGERPRLLLFGVGLTLLLTVLIWAVFSGSKADNLGRTISVAMIFAAPMLVLSVTVMLSLQRRIDKLPSPWDWILYFAALLVNAAIGLAIANVLLRVAGLVSDNNPWLNVGLLNRIAFLMNIGFATFGRIYAVTRERFERRTHELEQTVATDARERKLHQQDSERAREIQQALLPKQLPKIRGCDVAAGWQPANAVGGDYFDVIRLADDRAAIAIADVSGKGMGAALLMSNLQAIVRSFAASGSTAAELCARANEVISGNIAPGKFITFFFAIADLGRMQLDYCSAGHNPPILVRKDGTVTRLDEGGPLLGIFPTAKYPGGSTSLRSGDRLVLFTDGITEASNTQDEEFGEERVIELLQQSSPGESADSLRARIMESVSRFTGGTFQDDATIVVLTTM